MSRHHLQHPLPSPAILLGHLKLPFERIREAILACDDTVLSEHHLRQLETFAPNKKEVDHCTNILSA